MPTFADGEGRASIRSKINAAITIVDGLSSSDGTRVVFRSQTDAEGYSTFSTAPTSILLTGFTTADEFGQPRQYVLVGSEPTHSGKVTITLSGGGGDVYYEPDVTGVVTPEMYGGGITGVYWAFMLGRYVDLGRDTTYTGAVTYTITNTTLSVTGENVTFNATGRTTGSQGVFFNFTDAQLLHWDAQATFDLDNKYSGGVVARADSATADITLKRITINNPNYNSAGSTSGDPAGTGAYWDAIGIGVEGYYTASTPLQYASLHVEDCHVTNVIRAQQAGTCFGIYLGQAAKTRLINSTVNGVFLGTTASVAPASWFDADGVVYFTERAATSDLDASKAAYRPGDFEMTGCTIKNCQGRFVKTKLAGRARIHGNRFGIDTTTSGGLFYLIQDNWYGIDQQEDGAVIEQNEWRFDQPIVNQVGAFLCSIRTGESGTAPLTAIQQRSSNAFRDQTIRMQYGGASAARNLSACVFWDFDAMVDSGNGRYVTSDISRNHVLNSSGYSATATTNAVAQDFWYPNLPAAFNSLNAEVRIFLHDNHVDCVQFTEVSGWTGSGTHTNYLLISLIGNLLNNNSATDIFDTSGGVTAFRLIERDNISNDGTAI